MLSAGSLLRFLIWVVFIRAINQIKIRQKYDFEERHFASIFSLIVLQDVITLKKCPFLTSLLLKFITPLADFFVLHSCETDSIYQ